MQSRIFVLGLLLVLVSAVFADFSDVLLPAHVAPGGNVLISGYVFNSLGDPVDSANVTAEYVGGSVSNLTNASGYFSISYPASLQVGESEVNITNNYSASDNLTFVYFVTNVDSVEFSVVGAPDFTLGSWFILNMTLKNATGDLLVNYPASSIILDVFEANGPEQEWDVANLSYQTDASGSISYNITISDDATSSAYALIVNNGVGAFMFSPRFEESGLEFIIGTETEGGQFSNYFAPGEPVSVFAKLRDPTTGELIPDASVGAVINLPNGSTVSLALLANQEREGKYNATFLSTGDEGEYFTEIKATIGNVEYKRFIEFTVSELFVELIPAFEKEGKIFGFGNIKGAQTGSEVPFYLLVKNQSNGALMNASADGSGGAGINCSTISLISFIRVENNTDYASQIQSSFNASQTQKFMGGIDVCYVTFTAPDATGMYKLMVQVNITGSNYIAEGWIPIQSYYLSIYPILDMGGGGSDNQIMIAKPENNVTMKVRAYFLNGTEVDSALITGITPLQVEHMPSRTVFEFPDDLAYVGTDEDANTVTFTTPALTDALRFEALADVDGDTVIGSTVFFSKYVVGNLRPSGTGGGSGQSPEISCSGSVNFSGEIINAETGQFASGVSVLSTLYEAREEATGKNMLSCFNLTPTVSTNSSSPPNIWTAMNFNLGSGCTMHGAYFFLANLSFVDGSTTRQDVIPGWFSCTTLKANFDLRPANTQQPGPVSSQGCVNISVSNARNAGTGAIIDSGTINVSAIRIFQKETFGPPDEADSSVFLGSNIVNGNSTSPIIVCPQNFSKSAWSDSDGFVDFSIALCSGLTCDIFNRGIPVRGGSSAEMWFDRETAGTNPHDIYSNANVTFRFRIQSNVTESTPGTNITASIKVNGGGMAKPLNILSVARIEDNWNSEEDTITGGSELWEVNATIPSLSKGDGEIELCARGYTGAKSCFVDFVNIGGNVFVSSPRAELMVNGTYLNVSEAFGRGWNLTWMNTTFGLSANNPDELSGCVYDNLTLRRFTPQGEQLELINESLKVLVTENGTDSNNWLIFLQNTSMENSMYNDSAFIIAYPDSDDLSSKTLPYGLYAIESFGCNGAQILATTASSGENYVGDSQIDSEFQVYLVVRSGSGVAIPDAVVNITKIYRENENFGGMGEEFSGYTVTPGTTNEDGVAVVTLNISDTGRYMLYWSVTGPVNEVSGSSTALRTTIRSFMMFGFIPDYTQSSVVTVNNYTTGLPDLFNTSITGFMGVSGTKWFIYNDTSTMLMITNNTDPAPNSGTMPCRLSFEDNNPSTSKCNISAEYIDISSENFSVYAIGGNASLNASTRSFAFFQSSGGGGGGQPPSIGCNDRIYTVLCVQDFSMPAQPIPYATIEEIGLLSFVPGQPATETPLTMQNLISGQNVSSMGIGPSGCGVFYINLPVGGWPANTPLNIRSVVNATINGVERSEDLQILPAMMCS